MNIAIVDDDPRILASLVKFLSSIDHHVFSFERAADAMQTIQAGDIQLVLSDISMPGMDGFALLDAIKGAPHLRGIPVILFTGKGEVKDAVNAMKKGAYDYLLKPIDLNELMLLIERIGEYLSLRQENAELRNRFDEKVEQTTRELRDRYEVLQKQFARQVGMEGIGVFSAAMRRVFEMAARFHADPSIPVLIEGETGTGKEVVARYIHYGPEMSPQPFVDLNCASISPHLFESEIFGYEAGAFTGAKSKGEKGKIELAENGTLFLDEIGELPQEYQAKLLRVIQQRQFYRVGGLKKLTTNARIVCATNQNILAKVEAGEMRKDFYYRFQVGHLIIPPLRERPEAVLPLAALFLDQFRTSKKTRFERIHPSAAALLRHMPWYGNVRELRNVIERVLVLYDDTEILPEHVQAGTSSPLTFHADAGQNDIPALPDETLDEAIARIVRETLRRHDGNKSGAARALGISRDRLYAYLKK